MEAMFNTSSFHISPDPHSSSHLKICNFNFPADFTQITMNNYKNLFDFYKSLNNIFSVPTPNILLVPLSPPPKGQPGEVATVEFADQRWLEDFPFFSPPLEELASSSLDSIPLQCSTELGVFIDTINRSGRKPLNMPGNEDINLYWHNELPIIGFDLIGQHPQMKLWEEMVKQSRYFAPCWPNEPPFEYMCHSQPKILMLGFKKSVNYFMIASPALYYGLNPDREDWMRRYRQYREQHPATDVKSQLWPYIISTSE